MRPRCRQLKQSRVWIKRSKNSLDTEQPSDSEEPELGQIARTRSRTDSRIWLLSKALPEIIRGR